MRLFKAWMMVCLTRRLGIVSHVILVIRRLVLPSLLSILHVIMIFYFPRWLGMADRYNRLYNRLNFFLLRIFYFFRLFFAGHLEVVLCMVLVIKRFQWLVQLGETLLIALVIILGGLSDVLIDELELLLLQSLLLAYLAFLLCIIELQLLNLILHVLNLAHQFVNLICFLIYKARLVFGDCNRVDGLTPFLSHLLQIFLMHASCKIIIIINMSTQMNFM